MKNILVHIEWNDASLLEGYHKSDSESLGLLKMKTTGFLVAEKVHHVEVALTKTNNKNEYGEILSIPKSQIETMEILQHKEWFEFKINL